MVTKMPRFWMMKRSQKDSLDRSFLRLMVCCICWMEDGFTTWCSDPLLPLLLVLPSLICSSSSIIFEAASLLNY